MREFPANSLFCSQRTEAGKLVTAKKGRTPYWAVWVPFTRDVGGGDFNPMSRSQTWPTVQLLSPTRCNCYVFLLNMKYFIENCPKNLLTRLSNIGVMKRQLKLNPVSHSQGLRVPGFLKDLKR
jgi:hypothetical protein